MGRKVTQDEIKKWLALKERDWSDRAIGEKFHRDPKTVAKYLRPYLEPNRVEGSPLDPELAMLKRQKEKYEVLTELDRLREEREGLPKRLEVFEGEVNNLGITVKSFGEDLERLRLQFNSVPIANIKKNWKCDGCGSPDYPVVRLKCSRCGSLFWYGFVCKSEKKINLED